MWQSSHQHHHYHCFGVTIIVMMMAYTAMTMIKMMVMMMTVHRWQRVPMVGGFRGNGAPSSRPAPLCPFLRHYSPVRSLFFPVRSLLLPWPVVRLLWNFVGKLFFKSGAHWPVASTLAVLFPLKSHSQFFSCLISSILLVPPFCLPFKITVSLFKKAFVWQFISKYTKKITKKGE